jgi:hypothetical protein
MIAKLVLSAVGGAAIMGLTGYAAVVRQDQTLIATQRAELTALHSTLDRVHSAAGHVKTAVAELDKALADVPAITAR